MARLRQMEKIPGFDPASFRGQPQSVQSRRSLTALRERLLKGASAFAASRKRLDFVAIEMPLTLGTDLRQSRYSGFTQSETSIGLRQQRGDGVQ
jgi:hypothetical protein